MNKTASHVRVAQHAGFCFGVRRATDTLERLLAERRDGERVVTLGELIHNDIYNARQAARGVETIEVAELEELIASADEQAPVLLIVRAHGIPVLIRKRLTEASAANPSFRFVDCTCPFVARIHAIVEEHNKGGYQLWVFGDRNHPEVAGILPQQKPKPNPRQDH